MKYDADGKRILECVLCGTPLSGGIDTFGPLDLESCARCWGEYGISGDYDPWAQLVIANNRPGDVRYLNKAAERGTVHLPSSRLWEES